MFTFFSIYGYSEDTIESGDIYQRIPMGNTYISPIMVGIYGTPKLSLDRSASNVWCSFLSTWPTNVEVYASRSDMHALRSGLESQLTTLRSELSTLRCSAWRGGGLTQQVEV